MTSPAVTLLAELERIPTINSHSHLPSEQERLAERQDPLHFFGHAYPAADLRSAGMSADELARVVDVEQPLTERWPVLAPYWPHVRHTGFHRCIQRGFADLLGIDSVSADTVEPLRDALETLCQPGFYRQILRQRGGVVRTVVNMDDLIEVDRDLFLPLPRLNRFSMLHSASQLQAIEADYDVTIGSLNDLVAAIEQTCRDWSAAGVAGVKMSQSYHRPMDFVERDEADAQRIFDGLLRDQYDGLESAAGRLLEDYLVFRCCAAAGAAGLTVQFHQGMRAGNSGHMDGSSPAALTTLLRAFPDVRFDLSHAGYPYLREGAVLGKTFPNVFLNMSWIHIISPHGSRQDLREWLEMVPTNKIIAFGDDLWHVEAVYGHLCMARECFADVLGELVQQRRMSETEAVAIGRAAFLETPALVYGVDAQAWA